MSSLEVPLESILGCLQGVIPSPFATCGADGMPNVTYMSTVQYVDSDRVALSRQFFNKTAANLEDNPAAQVVVVDPASIDQYVLELEFLATETEGSTFNAMQSNLEAVTAHTGLGSVARLRGVDIHRVLACTRVSDQLEPPRNRDLQRDTLRALDELVRRLAGSTGFHEATRSALEGLEDLFGFAHSVILTRDGDRLVGAATNGYTSAATVELPIDAGLIGVAVGRREVVYIPHLGRSRIMAEAVDAGLERRSTLDAAPLRPLALPGPERVQSVAAVPLVAAGELLGALYLESEQPGTFGAQRERLLRIVGGHLASLLSALQRDRAARVPGPPGTAPAPDDELLGITYYQADDSVFADRDYVIKGVPGRILWKLLREHIAEGRVEFTNRELRLDERLGLPAGNDNLDSRLVALRRRLDAGPWGIALERIGRGHLRLSLERPITLAEVPTAGLMRHAHGLAEGG